MLFNLDLRPNAVILSYTVNGKKDSVTVNLQQIKQDVARWIKAHAWTNRYFQGVEEVEVNRQVQKIAAELATKQGVTRAYEQFKSKLPLQGQNKLVAMELLVADATGVLELNEYSDIGSIFDPAAELEKVGKNLEKKIEDEAKEQIKKAEQLAKKAVRDAKTKVANTAKQAWENAKNKAGQYTQAQLDKLKDEFDLAYDEFDLAEKAVYDMEQVAKEIIQQQKIEDIKKVAKDTEAIYKALFKKWKALNPAANDDQILELVRGKDAPMAMAIYNLKFNPLAINALNAIAKQMDMKTSEVIETVYPERAMIGVPSWVLSAKTFMANV